MVGTPVFVLIAYSCVYVQNISFRKELIFSRLLTRTILTCKIELVTVPTARGQLVKTIEMETQEGSERGEHPDVGVQSRTGL